MSIDRIKEAELVLHSSKLNISEHDRGIILEIIDDHIDWGLFLYYCCRNRVSPLVMSTFEKIKITRSIESSVYYAMKSICENAKRHNLVFYNEVTIINELFYDKGIRAVMLKGGVLAPLIYKDISLRQFNDIDYLIHVKDIPLVLEILKDNGYVQGVYDKGERKIISATKKEQMNRKLTSNEIFPHVKIDNIHGIPVHIDINFELFWKGSLKNENKFYFETGEIINEGKLTELSNSKIYILPPEYQVIHLCAHHYGDAMNFCWQGSWLRDKSEIALYKFCDLHELIISEKISWDKIYDISKNNKIEEPIYFSLKIVNQLFGSIVPDDFLVSLNVKETVVDKFYDKNGKIQYWGMNLYDRIFRVEDKFLEIRKKGIL